MNTAHLDTNSSKRFRRNVNITEIDLQYFFKTLLKNEIIYSVAFKITRLTIIHKMEQPEYIK